jgi:hypothetical protein
MSSWEFPQRHLSVRVPWHDAGWTGRVCLAPKLNGACGKLKRIAEQKRDDAEAVIAGQSLDDLPKDQWPCCVHERATFMAPFEMEVIKTHALAAVNPTHYGHFRPTPQRYPAYSAGIVPFRWMMRGSLVDLQHEYELDVDENREPELGYDTNWVHNAENQTALLNGFVAHLREEESLFLVYAKHVPFFEGTARVLVGAGRIKGIGELAEYKRQGQGMRGMIWERPVQHSIRPGGKDGFLMPYLEILQRETDDSALEVERYVARAPDEHWDEFSYASELVTHDGAIAALLSMDTVLGRTEQELGIDTQTAREWIHDELIRLWRVRGPYPGLGAVLFAFGLSRGIFVAHALQQKAGENADPWPLVDAMFGGGQDVLPQELLRDVKELAATWGKLRPERRAYLRLLSRFELTSEQAMHLYEEGSRQARSWGGSDREILQNPYRIYELSRHDPEGVRLLTIDRGAFPDDAVRTMHPLDDPSRLDSAADIRRLRAIVVETLEEAALVGHTLLPQAAVVAAVGELPLSPRCPVTGDMLSARVGDMQPEIVGIPAAGAVALQLTRYQKVGELVRKQIEGRLKGQRHAVLKDWEALVEKKFGKTDDAEELRARREKASALKELAESRFSVLAGPAGAGKTSVLGILCSQSEVCGEGVLLLAPTGKARVRMQELVGAGNTRAMTIAQFLNQWDRYDGAAGRYRMTGGPRAGGFGTVIIDESSMLTEDMLGALFDALEGVKRYILVGDPAQLPPIGAGRPFVDVIQYLRPADFETRFPRVGPGYAELTIERRQLGGERPDLSLARWFSSASPGAGMDDVFIEEPGDHPALRFVEWTTLDDFQQKLLDVLAQELHLAGPDDIRGFNRALGATENNGYDYFNARRNGSVGAVDSVENWQILSPLRGMPFGVNNINRKLHERFRAAFLELATQWPRSIPKPLGSERIVYGDKVINVSNHRRDGQKVYPREGALGYLANGEVGIAVGQWKTRGSPKILKVEFSSQRGYTYDFYTGDFREEGEAALELAYALTVHKAQGSQFKLVILVVPEALPILSRELIYTAITRHLDRVVILHQGPRSLLKDYTAPHRSETARRTTNLLRPCRMVEIPLSKGSVFLQEGLVHRTSRGLAVRSKSELIIAEALTHAGVRFTYEKALTLGGKTRFPDFTIEDDVSGRVFYWEHLGMLERPEYRRSWDAKLAWYKSNGVELAAESAVAPRMLICTTESASEGFDASIVQSLIRQYLAA